jgi:repressor LexA
MSKNLKYYIALSGKDRRELAEIWGFPYSTITDWINGKKYPRIDRIEVMADYFGILKSDLIEERTEEHREMQKKNNVTADIVLRMQTDDVFFEAVEAIYNMDSTKLSSLLALLK